MMENVNETHDGTGDSATGAPDATTTVLEAVANFRSVGGLRTADGASVRDGLLYRSGHLATASDADLALLERLGIRRVIDLRRPDEAESFGPDRLPPGSELMAHAILPQSVMFELHDRAGRSHQFDVLSLIYCEDPDTISELLVDGVAARVMGQVYELLVTDESACREFGHVLRALAEPDGMPAVIHCTAGKDRTGWLVAVVLLILGVDEEDIVTNYVESNAHRAANLADHRARWAEMGVAPEMLEPFVVISEDYLRCALAAMTSHWGGLDAYLRDGLGLDDEVIERLRAALRDDPAGRDHPPSANSPTSSISPISTDTGASS